MMKIELRKGYGLFFGVVGLILALFAWKLGSVAEMKPALLATACTVFALCGWVRIQVKYRVLQFVPDAIWGAAGLPLTFILSQWLLKGHIKTLDRWKARLILGSLICAIVVLLVYVISKSIRWSVILGLSSVMLLTTANSFVVAFRDNEMIPADFTSLGTAMNVAGNYEYTITPEMIRSWILLLAYFWVVLIFPRWVRPRQETVSEDGTVLRGKRIYTKWDVVSHISLRVIAAVFAFFIATGVMTYGTNRENVIIKHFRHSGTNVNGFLVNFYLRFSELRPSKPDGYSPEAISALEAEYPASDSTQSQGKEDLPTIVIIMDEAFADLSVRSPDRTLSTNEEVLPFISSLKEDTISGYALSSVFGGNTPNSEYEVLTGHSLAWSPFGAISYQNDVRDGDYSLVKILKDQGYHCTAMHPFLANGWRRPYVYSCFGFDEMFFRDDFPNQNLVRDYISDQEMFEKIIDCYEKGKQTEEPQFIFGVTMQNHSDYTYDKELFPSTIKATGYSKSYKKTNQYLTLIHETDKAVESLLTYFSGVDDNVIVLFYGDHQPKIENKFYDELHGGELETMDEKELRYMVPFFLWANYDIPEKHYDCTSLNYLSCDLMQVAGLELTPYQQFLTDVRDTIPAINQLGYYSIANQCFMELDQAEGEEAALLRSYSILQYNNLYDRKNTSAHFFPAVNK